VIFGVTSFYLSLFKNLLASYMNTKLIIGFSTVFFLGACASPTVVQSVKPGDAGLNCGQLQNEYADADNFKKEADGAKGVTGGNVARLLFWPSIVGTYMNANEAIAAADNRKVHLANQMIQKNCSIPGGSQIADVKPVELNATVSNTSASNSVKTAPTSTQSKESRLVELKRLFDTGLLTKDVYTERQKLIMDSP
jgi:hypothetical protein